MKKNKRNQTGPVEPDRSGSAVNRFPLIPSPSRVVFLFLPHFPCFPQPEIPKLNPRTLLPRPAMPISFLLLSLPRHLSLPSSTATPSTPPSPPIVPKPPLPTVSQNSETTNSISTIHVHPLSSPSSPSSTSTTKSTVERRRLRV